MDDIKKPPSDPNRPTQIGISDWMRRAVDKHYIRVANAMICKLKRPDGRYSEMGLSIALTGGLVLRSEKNKRIDPENHMIELVSDAYLSLMRTLISWKPSQIKTAFLEYEPEDDRVFAIWFSAALNKERDRFRRANKRKVKIVRADDMDLLNQISGEDNVASSAIDWLASLATGDSVHKAVAEVVIFGDRDRLADARSILHLARNSFGLTERHFTVMLADACGKTNQETATSLGLSYSRVSNLKSECKQIMQKAYAQLKKES